MDLSFTPGELAFAAEIRAWLDEHLELPPAFATLDDEITWGREWQAKLAADRWIGIHWPRAYGGRSASPVEVALYNMEYARSRALQPVNRVGINLAGPTLLAHGTDDQKARWLPRILDAAEIWCQLFSEPGAGSDLASLATRAQPVDGGWLVTGQKVWTSYAQYARWGIALVRTDPDAPKHRGISYVVVDMQVPGIEIRPLVQITGEAEFNEVFFDDVFVPEDHLVGGLDEGWAVANTTLAHERGTAFPFKEQVVHEVYLDELYALAAERGRLDDVEVADALAQAFVELRLLRLDNWHTLSRLALGVAPGPESSVTKLRWTDMTQHLSDTALDVLGPDAPRKGRWSRQWLWSKAASIAGGTSEVQRTIIGERLLGLPREGSQR
jgi:alkylation response protein AidB-like acyl-CoA dehydrogenase